MVIEQRTVPSMDLRKVEKAEQALGVGRFFVSSIIQKRVKELVHGGAPLVDIRSDNPMEIAIEEILRGRITMATYDANAEQEEPGLEEAAEEEDAEEEAEEGAPIESL